MVIPVVSAKTLLHCRRLALGVLTFLCLLSVATAQNARPARSREFPPGSVSRIEDLPQSQFRTRLERLPAEARARALAHLKSFHFTELDLESLDVDAAGDVLYVDHFALDGAAGVAAMEPAVAEAAVPVSPFPSKLIFHSRPGAPNVLFLNFSGATVSNTAWNTSLGRSSIPAVAFSSDTDLSTFSDAEQTAIKRIWQRVAEDYAPFNVDVTTERPATFGTRIAEALITRSTDANGAANPSSSAGGIAYVDAFATSTYAKYRPAWIYHDNLSSVESYVAEATSHEIGHNMGLSHDGKTDGTQYYAGHGSGETSWGPLMGTGYGRNVSQWSKGEYYLANNTQDDVATIAAKLSYRTDDCGDTLTSATPLAVTGGTNIVSTTPENDPVNTNAANKGVLERNTDVDVFSFAIGSGVVKLTVNPWIVAAGTRGANVDVAIELRNASGTLLATNNSATATSATIETNVSAGTYYLFVRNSSAGTPLATTPTGYTSYGSIGQYFVSGFIAPVILASPNPTNAVNETRLAITPLNAKTNVLSWNTKPASLYTVWWSTNASGPFARLASNLTASVTRLTNAVTVPQAFYRVEMVTP
jgi:hypothetical protein